MAHDAPHISDDTLELYALHRLDEPGRGRLEEHLLICPECQDHLAATDHFIDDLCSALESALKEIDPRKSAHA